MKNLLTIFTFLFTVMFSSISFAGWTKVSENVSGSSFYLDLERIRNHDGFVYFWSLTNYLKPDEWGDLSAISYDQGDCTLFRYKFLTKMFYKEPMGGGRGETIPVPEKFKDWQYPVPDSSSESSLKEVCGQ